MPLFDSLQEPGSQHERRARNIPAFPVNAGVGNSPLLDRGLGPANLWLGWASEHALGDGISLVIKEGQER
jgi:hypothetical protein